MYVHSVVKGGVWTWYVLAEPEPDLAAEARPVVASSPARTGTRCNILGMGGVRKIGEKQPSCRASNEQLLC